ncbi:pimeloyl-ACP methyl ester carboxylesterase [Actinoplanes lutulentus]|uniref:Pimeloyl-ACP methyl ester carboxylesterase n=1 Tax=Actinoplanes lutulentus TaxID=1287878 RepID=A0A327YWX3_9ACTN|nr:alpha/beta hydrolase [Actinoplanes lutulentus]MBB2943440.1 pimeloyl-ACP methyl ester carboxylesterase [Actinoplanes lutulentus]RAK26041.1 pimeloyl-ACP methyl ester carboxylesterase [Actinoplanes lutulentus]
MRFTTGRHRKAIRLAAAGVAVAGVAALLPTVTASASAAGGPKPTVVLVHGAWADGSSWNGVTERLQDDGYTVDVPPNPLRGVSSDSAYLADYLAKVTGPIVLVGHSYGGFLISNAALGNTNVKALVYVDAYLPAKGDSLGSLSAYAPGSQVGEAAFNIVGPRDGTGAYTDTYIKPELFPGIFANDQPKKKAALLAAGQRPLNVAALGEPSGEPAWKTIPSWDIVGTLDNVIPPATQRFMAERAGSHVTTIKAAHLSMVSQPAKVERVIVDAARKTS